MIMETRTRGCIDASCAFCMLPGELRILADFTYFNSFQLSYGFRYSVLVLLLVILFAHIYICARITVHRRRRIYGTRTLFQINKIFWPNSGSPALRSWSATAHKDPGVEELSALHTAAYNREHSKHSVHPKIKDHTTTYYRARIERESSIYLVFIAPRVRTRARLILSREWRTLNLCVAFDHRETLCQRYHPTRKRTHIQIRFWRILSNDSPAQDRFATTSLKSNVKNPVSCL